MIGAAIRASGEGGPDESVARFEARGPRITICPVSVVDKARREPMKHSFRAGVAFAAVATTALWLLANRPGQHGFDGLLIRAWVTGALPSGNAHEPNEAAVWATLFLMLLAVGWTATGVILLFASRLRRLRPEAHLPL